MACEEAVELLGKVNSSWSTFHVDPPEFEKQVEVLAELAYYESTGGKDGNIEVPLLIIDAYDSFIGAEKYVGQDAINKLKEMV